MRLLLDEHYSHVIAEHLRELGHDVICATEQLELVGLEDHDLVSLMREERRAILTENWADFQRESRKAEESGIPHYGVLFTSRKRLPRRRDMIGLYVRVLDDFLSRHPTEDAILNTYAWRPERPL